MARPEVALGYLLTFQRGFDLPQREREKGNVPVVSSAGVSGSHSEARAKGPGVVTGRYGTLGQTYYIKEDFWPHNTTLFVKDFKGNNRRFIYYLLCNLDFDRHSAVSAVPGVNRNDLHRLKVQRVPLPIQNRISDILGALDDKIDLNRRMNRTLEEMAQALYKHWFIDFGPFQDEEFQESALGPIPANWKVGALKGIAEVVMGSSPKGTTYNDEGIGVPLVNGPAQYGDYFPVASKWTTAPTVTSQEGDLVFCVRGSTTGRRVLADGEYCLGRGVCAIRGRNGAQNYVNLTIDYHLDRLLTHTTGSVFPNLSGPTIKGLQILFPPDNVLRGFCSRIDPLFQAVWANIKEEEHLSRTRDYLLPRLLSGEIEIEVIEEVTSDVL